MDGLINGCGDDYLVKYLLFLLLGVSLIKIQSLLTPSYPQNCGLDKSDPFGGWTRGDCDWEGTEDDSDYTGVQEELPPYM